MERGKHLIALGGTMADTGATPPPSERSGHVGLTDTLLCSDNFYSGDHVLMRRAVTLSCSADFDFRLWDAARGSTFNVAVCCCGFNQRPAAKSRETKAAGAVHGFIRWCCQGSVPMSELFPHSQRAVLGARGVTELHGG